MNPAEIPQGTAAPQPSDHRDRRAGLITFGILEILLGALALLLCALMVFGQRMLAANGGAPANMNMMLPAIAVYGGAGAAFVGLGIGSILCRRWARALLLVWAWPWMCMGFIGVPLMAWLLPRMLASGGAGPQGMPTGALMMIVVIQIVVMSVLMILIPGAIVWFYGNRHTKATCEARDPNPGWTDACPLPVLGVSCLTTLSAAWMLVFPFTGMAVFPLFGALVSGVPAIVLALAFAGLLLWIGRAWYRVRVAGWRAVVALLALGALSNVITFTRVDMAEMYQKMGYGQEMIDMIRKQGLMNEGFMIWATAIWIVPTLAYLIWVKRYFRSAA
ncbi:MAG: hypothetical protein HY299_01475 [Verrucomicrobia bacterium]|nr:hypothetical protein [Verrucomicrobiota bacterium]